MICFAPRTGRWPPPFPFHRITIQYLHQSQRAVPSLTPNSMTITLANPVKACGKGCFFVLCIGSTPTAPPLRRLPMPYMKTGETAGANHAFIRQEQAFVKAQRARDGRGYSEDEVCDAGAPVGVH
jgi:hypothetical protein